MRWEEGVEGSAWPDCVLFLFSAHLGQSALWACPSRWLVLHSHQATQRGGAPSLPGQAGNRTKVQIENCFPSLPPLWGLASFCWKLLLPFHISTWSSYLPQHVSHFIYWNPATSLFVGGFSRVWFQGGSRESGLVCSVLQNCQSLKGET